MATQRFFGFEYEDDALDPKTRQLCALAAAAEGGCSHWLDEHFADAKEAGATTDDIRRVLVTTMMVSTARTKHFITDTLEGVGNRS